MPIAAALACLLVGVGAIASGVIHGAAVFLTREPWSRPARIARALTWTTLGALVLFVPAAWFEARELGDSTLPAGALLFHGLGGLLLCLALLRAVAALQPGARACARGLLATLVLAAVGLAVLGVWREYHHLVPGAVVAPCRH